MSATSTWFPISWRGSAPTTSEQLSFGATASRPTSRVDITHVADIPISVDEVTADLVARLPDIGTVGFRELTEDLATSIEVVVYFLAVLELYKRGMVEVSQASTFGRIAITWCGEADLYEPLVGVDAYEG